MTPELTQQVVAEVLRRLSQKQPTANTSSADGRFGIFSNVDQAIAAAVEAQQRLVALSMSDRDAIVRIFKDTSFAKSSEWGTLELAETKIGRLDHKIEKLTMLRGIPGVEALKTTAYSGSNGIGLDEYAPFGVIGAVLPVTHSIPTLTANAINMIAAGNAVVFNAHPSGMHCAAVAIREYNRQIAERFGIEHLLCLLYPSTLETADSLFNHRDVPLLVVTGGPVVARAAMAAKKRSIVAGPGNPPVVVDETACLDNAAKSIIRGGAYDNNLLCIGEKQVFVVASVFDQLVEYFKRHGAVMLNGTQVDALTNVAMPLDPKDGKHHPAKGFIGKDPSVLAAAIGLTVPASTQLLIGETHASHPFVQVEQMMPFVPLIRCKDARESIDLAIASEHGYRHTAIIHSRNLDNITRFGKRAGTTIFVANSASVAGLGNGGEGYGSFSIATPTGEGITSPLTFTRFRRVAIANSLRMI
jgi:aldehyde dehydrogenase